MNTDAMFSKASDEWSTPHDLYTGLDCEFGFRVDAAAQSENALECFYYNDALGFGWFETNGAGPYWLNPPYSKCRQFIAKAAEPPQRTKEKDMPYYGPHNCETCGQTIVKQAREDGSAAFDVPELLMRIFRRGAEAGNPDVAYPMTWTPHVCLTGPANPER